jgi:bacillithiol biosynthesis cysteine-adding enzyme BshC
MDWISSQLPYRQTGYFSRIIIDYLNGLPELAPFYSHPVSIDGFREALAEREKWPVDRGVLVSELRQQYHGMQAAPAVLQNIESLGEDRTFTVCTAHQPALFTGHLYFIYKILHTIRLAQTLAVCFPTYRFVPVFWMGSEDADLDELGHIYLDNEKLVWDTRQTGAVGRMKTKGLEKILQRIEGEFSVQPFGKELVGLLKEAYLGSPDIQTATFRLIHRLFAEWGLVVLIPDLPSLKKRMIPVFEDDLFRQAPTAIVNGQIDRLAEHYKVQANPRPINLFYLRDDIRGRIERIGDRFVVHESSYSFTEEEIRKELDAHPERFSPNVILRGLFQETILPNLAFVGGGGETSYWLELKDLFTHYKVPFPVLVLRNSFLLVDKVRAGKLRRAGLAPADLFRPAEDLVNELVKRSSEQQLNLDQEIAEALQYYENLKTVARPVDHTLVQHVEALQVRALEPLRQLEKKLLKAEKRKYSDLQRQIHSIKNGLFPQGGLQERIDNFLPWYAMAGPRFFRDLYDHSLALEQEFVVLLEK